MQEELMTLKTRVIEIELNISEKVHDYALQNQKQEFLL